MTLAIPTRPPWRAWPRLVFLLALLFTLGLLGLNGLLLWRPEAYDGILNPNITGAAAAHFDSLDHRMHDLAFTLLVATGAVGLLAQLRTPRRNVAAQCMALVPWVSMAVVFPLTSYWTPPATQFPLYATAVYGGFTLSAALLHPTGRYFVSSFGIARINRVMLALVVTAAVPLLALAWTNIELQRDDAGGTMHGLMGHYGFMAALSLTIPGVGVVASLRPVGWRLTAWVTGILPAGLGLLSLAYRDVDSSLRPGWALAAIAWGAAFVVVGEHGNAADDGSRTGRDALEPTA
jgi:hypothetical protein